MTRLAAAKRIERVVSFLASESTLSLATTAAGTPRVTPLFYFAEGLSLYWFSAASSGHTRSLRVDPRAAVAIYRGTDDWRQIQGVQMRGAAAPVSDPPLRRRITAEFCDRFRLSPILEPAIARSALYCFTPEWLRYIDNSRRFGYKFELRV